MNNTTNENILTKLKTPSSIYTIVGFIILLIIVTLLIFFDVNLISFGNAFKSHQELIANIFIILFFSLLIFGICVLFLPNLKEFKQLFEQIGSVTYVILYTIFAILFYTMTSKDILNKYYYIINPIIVGLGCFSFYKATNNNFIETFDVNYERIKMLILLFCFITIMITFYNINPGNTTQKYLGYSLLLTIILSVFAFLYLIILFALPGNKDGGSALSGGLIGFFAFLILTILIILNDKTFFDNKEKSSSIIVLLLIISILWCVLIGVNSGADSLTNNVSLFKNSLLVLFGLVISGLIIFWITYNLESLAGNSSITSFVLNLLLISVVIGLIYKTIHVKLPLGNKTKNSFFDLLFAILFYIPCLLGYGFDKIGSFLVGEYNATNAGSILMLIVAVALFIIYFYAPSLFNLVSTQGGKQLVNKPVYTDTQYNLGTYQDLNEKDDFNYQYAISCWIYIDSAGPNMNANYNKYTSLLNFGDKPNVLYNGKKHSLMITTQQKNLQDVTKNKMTDFDDNGNRIVYVNDAILLQKWNNLIINYNGGTLDVFLNGELVKSSIEVVPYYTYENLTIGENNGIKGGICNVVYFRRTLTSQNIYYIYNTLKDRTPPVLNDSKDTILVNK